MKLVDANVLLYAANTAAAQHGPSVRWLNAALSGTEGIGFAWSVMLAVVRVATHPSAFVRPLSASDAIGLVQEWLAQPPSLVVTPTARHLDLLAGLLREAGTGGNLVPDAHLATLALEYDATIVSFDRDFGRFRGLRLEVP